MANGEVIAYSIASFTCALFVLEFGADKFIDHTAVVANRTGIPQGIIGLLTAGAEWEELAVVVFAIIRRRSSLAIGNIIGSAISNILGAFALGLIFYKGGDQIVFDQSSKIYCLILLVLTFLIAGLTEWGHHDIWKIVGGIAIGIFVLYLASIAWFIVQGRMTAPEDSDSDSDTDSESDSNSDSASDAVNGPQSEGDQTLTPPRTDVPIESPSPANTTATETITTALGPQETDTIDTSSALSQLPDPITTTTTQTPLAPQTSSGRPPSTSTNRPRNHSHSHSHSHNLTYHITHLILGFLAILLSSYTLTNAATAFVDEVGLSDVLFGVVILSIATTLPEKFIAVLSGHRGHAGILVANTVGSNIFLLSLCMGLLWASTGGNFDRGSVNVVELAITLGSTVTMMGAVWVGGRWSRWVGGVMLLGYVVFLVLEFTVIRRVWVD